MPIINKCLLIKTAIILAAIFTVYSLKIEVVDDITWLLKTMKKFANLNTHVHVFPGEILYKIMIISVCC